MLLWIFSVHHILWLRKRCCLAIIASWVLWDRSFFGSKWVCTAVFWHSYGSLHPSNVLSQVLCMQAEISTTCSNDRDFFKNWHFFSDSFREILSAWTWENILKWVIFKLFGRCGRALLYLSTFINQLQDSQLSSQKQLYVFETGAS